MKIVGLVAVRSGSVRVENKNIRPFAGRTILDIKLEQLKRINLIDEVYVNSNDDYMLEIARQYDCIPIKRDPYYASNEVSMNDVYENMAQNCDGDIIVYCNATNPLVKDDTIVKAIEKFITQNDFDSLNSAHPIKEFLFKDNQPHNFCLEKFPRSQDLPDIVALNFAINIIFKKDMIKNKHIIGKKPFIQNINSIEGTDIDDISDFEFAEFMYKKDLTNKTEENL